MDIINQPIEDTLGYHLKRHLHYKYDFFYFMVAYAKISGIKHLLDDMMNFRKDGGIIKAIIGIDQYNTSAEAIQALYNLCDELYIYHSSNFRQTFHPKMYYFSSQSKLCYFCGSNNLTEGGLFSNNELCTYEMLSTIDTNYIKTKDNINNLFSKYFSDYQQYGCIKMNKSLIAQLINDNLLLSEYKINKVIKNNATASISVNKHQELFPTTAFAAPPAHLENNLNEYLFVNLPIDSSNQIRETAPQYIHRPVTQNMDLLYSENSVSTYDVLYNNYQGFLDNQINQSKNYYYIPQGVHIGHIFYLVKALKEQKSDSLDFRIKLYNEPTSGPHGTTVRQTRYKISACMEMLLIEDDRLIPKADYTLKLTNNGHILYDIIKRNVTDHSFFSFTNEHSWRMVHNTPSYYTNFIKRLNAYDKGITFNIFSNLTIFKLLIKYIEKNKPNDIAKAAYSSFWYDQEVQNYLAQLKMNTPNQTSLEHRIPFLMSLLNAFDFL